MTEALPQISELYNHELPLEEISLTGWNPRKRFDEEELRELQESIREKGVLQPILIRPSLEGNGYQLVAGERRYRASIALELPTIPAVIKDLSDREVKEIMLLENIQRQDLDPIEEARAIREVLDEGVKQEEIAQKLGKSQSWVANRLRLLRVCERDPNIEQLLISREISPKHALVLVPYIDYPVYERISQGLKDHLERGNNDYSVSDFQRTVFYAVTNDWHAEYALEIPKDGSVPWKWEKYAKHLDFTECQKCEHVRSFPGNEEQIYCLNRSCFKDKINKAAIATQKDAEQLLEASRDENGELKPDVIIDTSQISYGDFESLNASWADFDKTDCEGCEYRRITTDDNIICLNPKCYNGKRSAATRQRNKEQREKRDEMLDHLHTMVEDNEVVLSNQSIRQLIFRLAFNSNKEKVLPLEFVTGSKVKSVFQQDKVWTVVNEVDEEDLEGLLLELMIWQELRLPESRAPTEEQLQEAIKKVVGE